MALALVLSIAIFLFVPIAPPFGFMAMIIDSWISKKRETSILRKIPLFPKAVVISKSNDYVVCSYYKRSSHTNIQLRNGVITVKALVNKSMQNSIVDGDLVYLTPDSCDVWNSSLSLRATIEPTTENSFLRRASDILVKTT